MCLLQTIAKLQLDILVMMDYFCVLLLMMVVNMDIKTSTNACSTKVAKTQEMWMGLGMMKRVSTCLPRSY